MAEFEQCKFMEKGAGLVMESRQYGLSKERVIKAMLGDKWPSNAPIILDWIERAYQTPISPTDILKSAQITIFKTDVLLDCLE